MPYEIITKRYTHKQRRRYLVVSTRTEEVQSEFRGRGCQKRARDRVKLLHTLERVDWREPKECPIYPPTRTDGVD